MSKPQEMFNPGANFKKKRNDDMRKIENDLNVKDVS